MGGVCGQISDECRAINRGDSDQESEGQLWTAFCQRLSSGIGIQRAQRVACKVLEVQVLVMKSATRCLGWPLFDQSVSNNLGSTVG